MRLKLLVLGLLFSCSSGADWRTADRSSVGLTPAAKDEPRAVVQIYSARTYGWKGNLAVHSWMALKEKGAREYTVYEVIGYGSQKGIPVIRSRQRAPDQRWFGNEPTLHFDLRGTAAEEMIPHVLAAVKSYPYPDSYRMWPGPNSNTFVSHIMRNTPGIAVELPPNAIGKDWIGSGQPLGLTESGTGVQVSVAGALGFTIGAAEGIEVNILGMTFGIDLWRPALKLPFIGRLGFADAPLYVPKGF
ncbi:MAG: DUF3750 domain-containing protein [Bdellovibrio sp.]|nr:DUF3750 domain-containing protein [Bdellovibrio sp.]